MVGAKAPDDAKAGALGEGGAFEAVGSRMRERVVVDLGELPAFVAASCLTTSGPHACAWWFTVGSLGWLAF